MAALSRTSVSYDYGTPSANIEQPDKPTKQPDVQYTYSFSGWSPELSKVTQDVTYKATYTPHIRSYEITWNMDDGTLINKGDWPYGTTPTHEEPFKGDQYEFVGWNPAVSTVTGDATYTAVFADKTVLYTAYWLRSNRETIYDPFVDKTIAEIEAEHAKKPAPTQKETAEWTFTFTGWEPVIDQDNHTITYFAKFSQSKRRYTITWNNFDGSLIYSETVAYDGKPTYTHDLPVKPDTEQYSYTFSGWKDSAGNLLDNETKVTKDETYTAQFNETLKRYDITFVDEDGKVLKETKSYNYGTTVDQIEKPANPTKESTVYKTYTFIGWDPQLDVVKSNVIYKAVYQEADRLYEVKFVNYDGTELFKHGYRYGQLPAYDGTPTRDPNEEHTYEFKGWKPDLVAVSQDAVYTADYYVKPRQYVVRFVMGVFDDVEAQNVEYSNKAVKPADPVSDTYRFTGWYKNPDFSQVFDFDQEVIVTDTLIFAGYLPKIFQITLDPNGGTVSEEYVSVEYGKPYGKLPEATKPGLIFDGWYTDSSFTRKISADDIYDQESDSTLVARYKYQVFFKQLDGTVTSEYVFDDDRKAKRPEGDFDKEVYYFDYWVTSSTMEKFDFENDEVQPNMTFFAKYHKYIPAGSLYTWVMDEDGNLDIRFLRYEHISKDELSDLNLREHFIASGRKAFVDGVLLNESWYDPGNGSLIISLHEDYLNTLSVGTHKLTVKFVDGEVSADFVIRERTKPSSPDYVIPKTGN